MKFKWKRAIGAAATVALLSVGAANAADRAAATHGLSLFGSVKYPTDFEHFDYVNPDAPKGGTLRMSAIGGFDSLNPFIVKGRPVTGIGFIYETLMTSSLDEASTEYGLIAKSVWHPEDYSSVTFWLRPEAKWHDGVPVTANDVVWSFEQLKQNHPFYNAYYADVAEAVAEDDHTVTFRFSAANNRELPLIVGQLYVLPKHYWEGADPNGKQRDISATTLEPPLGSGPYRVGEIKTGRSITYERVDDYWANDLPVNVGKNNFDRIRVEYFGDATVALEAFKADAFDYRAENSAKNWATAYDIKAVRDGDIVLEKITTKNAQGMQAFVFNTRRSKFQDRRVREAFNWAFDFEWQNRTLFYDQYTRTNSFFANSELAATGLPTGKELEILEPFRDQLPAEVFEKEFANPVTDGSGNNRQNLRKATALLREAGWTVEDGTLINKNSGEPMSIEFLVVQPTFERVVAPYVKSLQRLGIQTSIRTIDTAQYQNRTDNYDFDIIIGNFGQSLSPGNEQRDFWGSESADTTGGRNLIGIKDPVVDALIEQIIFAKDRETLVATTRALDRVLLWGHYVVPQWHIPYSRVAYWKRLAHPDPTPAYSIGYPGIWWYDAAAAAELKPRASAEGEADE